VLGPVPRRVDRANENVADLDLGPVLERFVLEARACERMNAHGDAVLEGEPAVPGDVVGVCVSLEDADDPDVAAGGIIQQRFDCVRRIDRDRTTGVLVADDVRGTTEIIVDELAEKHGPKLPLPTAMSPELKRALPAVVLLALALPAAASAHANLVRTDPPSGAVLAGPPAGVKVVFDDVVRVGPGIEAIRNGGGSVLGASPSATADTLTIPLRRHLPDGDYSVRWSIISDDGHLESGVVAFAVGTGRAPPRADLKAEATGPGVGGTLTRWLFLAGVLGAVGIALYALLVLGLGHARARRVAITLGATAVLVAAGAGIEAARIGLGTRYGTAMGAGFVLACLVGAGSIVALRPALVLALGLAVVPSLSGHALDPGLPRINVAVDVLHVLGAAAWVGVLVGVLVAPGDRRRTGLLAAGGVLLLGITGAVRAAFELTAVSQLWDTSYGKTILVKTGIALVALALGWLLHARLRRRAAAELVLVAGLVVAVAVLVQLRPGRNYVAASAPTETLQATPNPPVPPAAAVVLAREAGSLAVALEAEPHRLTAIVLSPAGGGMSGLHVRFLPLGVAGNPCGSGCYASPLVEPGRSVRVEISGFGSPKVIAFTLPRHAPSASVTVARLRQAYRALGGVTYVERLASSPANVIVARWRLESPDRFAYAIKGSGAGIVIGSHRWDQDSPGGRWQKSTQDPILPQPATFWVRATNAHVLAVHGPSETVSFFDPGIGAFFTLTFDRRTLRPRVLHMTAVAHFMVDRYLSFNPARQIRPPR
jgi:copper transport protein